MTRQPTYVESLLSISFIVIFIFGGYFLFDFEIVMMMVAAASCAGLMALRVGLSWKDLEATISEKLTSATPAILIIWVIGVVIASFIFSGSIPMFIYFGIQLVDPQYVFVSSFIICVIFSSVTGSSWGSVGTAGIALMSIAGVLDVPLHITAGAIISGAVFGDKMSPLSETTNLASATSGVDLYEHIKSMTWTTFPAAVFSCIVFFVAGQLQSVSGQNIDVSTLGLVEDINSIYSWSLLLLVPFFVILLGAVTKKPPVPVMLLASFIALLIGAGYQGFSVSDGVQAMLSGFSMEMLPGIESGQLSSDTLTLLERGGITSMVSVVLIIYSGYAYTSIITRAGFLDVALKPLTTRVQKRGPLMVTTLFTELFLLVLSGTSYTVAILIPPMFKKAFINVGMGAKTLSRTIEDVGTMMAALVPWGTSGAFYITTLGIAAYGSEGYWAWCVMAFSTPIVAIILAFAGVGIYQLNREERDSELSKLDAQAVS